MERTKYLNTDEVKRLRTLTKAKAIEDKDAKRVTGVLAWMVVDTALSTGLRVSELAALKVEDIDFERSLIHVNRLKRKKPYREQLAVADEFLNHLKEYLRRCRNGKRQRRKRGRLFIGKRGPLTAQGLQWIWKAAVKRAGLPAKLTIHSARHTVAVHLLRKTRNLKQVQKQLGHKSIESTANMYADIPFEDMRDGMTGLYDN